MIPHRIDDVLYWVQEREAVRIRKEQNAPWPWSDDPAFQTIHFCNVRREEDRVTRWIRENWREPNLHSPHMPIAMAIARLVNLPETLEELGYPIDGWYPEHFINTLAGRKARGEKVWTNAYMVTGGYSAGGESKEVIIARVLDGLDRRPLKFSRSYNLAEWDILLTTPGIGSFLRGQIIADLKYTPELIDADDWWSWCTPGPGSTAGLNILHDRPLTASWKPADFRREVNELRHIIGRYIHAQDMQNVLCEFSKWWKFTKLNVRPKNTYRRKPPTQV